MAISSVTFTPRRCRRRNVSERPADAALCVCPCRRCRLCPLAVLDEQGPDMDDDDESGIVILDIASCCRNDDDKDGLNVGDSESRMARIPAMLSTPRQFNSVRSRFCAIVVVVVVGVLVVVVAVASPCPTGNSLSWECQKQCVLSVSRPAGDALPSRCHCCCDPEPSGVGGVGTTTKLEDSETAMRARPSVSSSASLVPFAACRPSHRLGGLSVMVLTMMER